MPRFHSVVSDVKLLTPTILELAFQRKDRQVYPVFQPGQYATLSFPDYGRIHGERSFSIASSAADRATLRFGIRLGGKYTQALRRVRVGDTAILNVPFGSFTFDPIRDQHVLLIAGGIGITPFMSMIRTAVALRLPNTLHLLYSVRSLADAAYVEELGAISRKASNIAITYVVGDRQVPKNDSRYRAGFVTQEMIAEAIGGNLWGQSYFLCGPPKFMNIIKNHMTSLGVPKKAIRTERFGVGSSAIIETGSPIPKWAFVSWGVATAAVLGYIAHVEQEKREHITASVINASRTTITNTVTAPVNTSTASLNTNTTIPTVNTAVPVTPIANTSVPTSTTPVTTPSTNTSTTVTPTPVVVPPTRFQPRTTVS